MDPASRTYTVAMPWYERADFYELWALSADDHDVPRDYERWHSEACRVMREHLAAGRAIQFIRIKPADYAMAGRRSQHRSHAIDLCRAARLRHGSSTAYPTAIAAPRGRLNPATDN